MVDEPARRAEGRGNISDSGRGDSLTMHHGQGGGHDRLATSLRGHSGHGWTLIAIAHLSNNSLRLGRSSQSGASSRLPRSEEAAEGSTRKRTPMIRTTPFHPRLAELSQTGLWGHWAGYLSAVRYDYSAKYEYFGVRNAAAFFDASPLYKYWIRGRDAERYLGGVMARDIRTCRPGRAQYTVWCDDAGYVLEDGVVFRHAADEFLLTAAEPNLSYLRSLIGSLQVEITDASEDYGIL
ncbi:MAG: hypothetical protein F2793_08315, partial [Actinobacteria bacterium]|nr:hypothetical protein [Actinomycetota bacterium]